MENKNTISNTIEHSLSFAARLTVLGFAVFILTGIANAQTNLARGKTAKQSSTRSAGGAASRAVDGITSGVFSNNSVTHTASESENGTWWEVDLGGIYSISQIKIFNRTDCCQDRLNNMGVKVSNTPFRSNSDGILFGELVTFGNIRTFNASQVGRYIRIYKKSGGFLSLAEVEVYGSPVSTASTSSVPVRNTATNSSNDFYMMIAADPQYPWKDVDFIEGTHSLRTRADLVNIDQVSSIVELANKLDGKQRGVIINGDLTAYGHPWQRASYFKIWGNLTRYEGLGNHDYSNNLGGCAESCANRMIEYMKSRIRLLKPPYSDPDSLAYGWDIGNVHFIQLHNYPAFVANTGTYNIKSSMGWLEEDLRKARAAGKAIIINLHDYNDKFKKENEEQFNEFNNLLQRYKVSAVFAGHIHKEIGKIADVGKTPIFRSGSPMYNNYLLVHFNGDKMKVEKVNSKDAKIERSDVGEYDLDTSTQINSSSHFTSPDRTKKTTYKVRIKTGTSGAGGTDANIYISFTGRNGQTEEYKLDKADYNDFEAGDDDEYVLNNVLDVGNTIKGFRIRSDLSNPGYPWLLEKVTITKGTSTLSPITVNQVLQNDNNKSLYFDLSATSVSVNYTIKIYTGTKTGAGTDSNIDFTLCGSNGCTKTIRLNLYINGNAFENGKTDTVNFADINVGTNMYIKVKSDDKYSGSDWYLNKIEVNSAIGNKTFTINTWFEETDTKQFN